jgi:hypothetical protein
VWREDRDLIRAARRLLCFLGLSEHCAGVLRATRSCALGGVRECRAGAGEDKGTQAADWSSSVNKRPAVIWRSRCCVVLRVV